MKYTRGSARGLGSLVIALTLALSPVAGATEPDDDTPATSGPNPWIAGTLSLVMPGLGQWYAGETNRGLFVLLGGAALIAAKLVSSQLAPSGTPLATDTQPKAPLAALDLVFTLALPTYWAWNVGDAVRLALPPSDVSSSPSPVPTGGPPL